VFRWVGIVLLNILLKRFVIEYRKEANPCPLSSGLKIGHFVVKPTHRLVDYSADSEPQLQKNNSKTQSLGATRWLAVAGEQTEPNKKKKIMVGAGGGRAECGWGYRMRSERSENSPPVKIKWVD